MDRATQARDALGQARRDVAALPEFFRQHLAWWIGRAEASVARAAPAPAPAPALAADPPAHLRFWADPNSVEGRAIQLWETGQRSAARDTIDEAIDELAREGLASANQHHQMGALARLLDALRAMGDADGFRASAVRIADAVEGWAMPGDWVAAAVHCQLAPYLHEAGQVERCRQSLDIALAAAEAETSASSDPRGQVASALQKCGQPDRALGVAGRIRPAHDRRKRLIELLTLGKRATEAEAVYRSAGSAPERVKLALAVARSWPDA